MKKIILTIDDDGHLADDIGSVVMAGFGGMSYQYKDQEETGTNNTIDAVKLVGLGVTPDELIKLRATGII